MTRDEIIATAIGGIASDTYAQHAQTDADWWRGHEARAFARHGRHGLSAVTVEETAAAMGVTGPRLDSYRQGWEAQGLLP
jgi:hypothetical protein